VRRVVFRQVGAIHRVAQGFAGDPLGNNRGLVLPYLDRAVRRLQECSDSNWALVRRHTGYKRTAAGILNFVAGIPLEERAIHQKPLLQGKQSTGAKSPTLKRDGRSARQEGLIVRRTARNITKGPPADVTKKHKAPGRKPSASGHERAFC